MAKNYYLVLGVSPQATIREIKNAYRKLAKKYHPDHHGADAVPFLAIQEAYAVLSDPARKKMYDRSLGDRKGPAPQGRPNPAGVGSPVEAEPLVPERGRGRAERIRPDERFSRFPGSGGFLFDLLRDGFPRSCRQRSAGLPGRRIEIRLTPMQAQRGGSIRLLVPVLIRCPSCMGNGFISAHPCGRCGGSGIMEDDCPVVVDYPPGTPHGYTVRLPIDQHGVHLGTLTVRFAISIW